MTKLKANEAIIQAISDACKTPPTEQELRNQKVSFIYGSLGDRSTVSRDRIIEVLAAHEGRGRTSGDSL